MADPKDLLAAERTLLAWIRTGIALMAFGFVVARFGLFLRELARVGGHVPTQRFDSTLVGSFVVATGVALNVWASFRHRVIVRNLHQGTNQIGTAGPIAIGLASAIGGLILIAVTMGALSR